MIKKILKNIFSKKIDLDQINAEDDLDALFIRFGSDKGSLDGKKTFNYFNKSQKHNSKKEFLNYKNWVQRSNLYEYSYQLGLNFSPIYEKYFQNIKDKNNKFLEIGVANGHSLASFYKYFSNSDIHGIDRKEPYKLFYTGKRLNYYDIDIFNRKKINNFKKNNPYFDIIIDDSLHNEIGILTNFVNFYQNVSPGGFYIIEDFKYNDIYKKEELKYNLENKNKYLGLSHLTITNFFSFLNDKNKEVYSLLEEKAFFESNLFSKSFFDYVFETLEFSKLYFTEHPWGSTIIIKKNDKF